MLLVYGATYTELIYTLVQSHINATDEYRIRSIRRLSRLVATLKIEATSPDVLNKIVATFEY